MLHGHGNDIYRYSKRIKLDFSSNVWYEPPSDKLLHHLADSLKTVSNYPDPDAGPLVTKLAEFHELSPDNVLVTNGSIEGMYLLAQVYQGRKSGVVVPCFSEYEDACTLHKHEISFLQNEIFRQHGKVFKEDLIWFGNPNNPDGKQLSIGELRDLLERNPETIHIVDEAYAELCPSFVSGIPLLHEFPNLVIIRSFTKCFSIPGIRLGYLLASPKLILQIQKYRIPWVVSSLAIEAGLFILVHFSELLPDPERIKAESADFHRLLSSVKGMKVHPTSCNFLLAELDIHTAAWLKDQLIHHQGILIRDASNFRGLNERFFRVSLRKPEENRILVKALDATLKILPDASI